MAWIASNAYDVTQR